MDLVIMAIVVFVGFGIMSMAGLGAATLFIPIFYYSGVPLPEAISTGLLLNIIALSFSLPHRLKAGKVNFRLGLPIIIAAALLAPLGAAVSHSINRNVLLGLFAGFLIISGASMLFYQRSSRTLKVSQPVEIGTGTAVGSAAGFLAGLLGVGGGAFVLPVLHGVGVEPHEASAITALVALVSSISGFAARASLGSLDVTFVVVTGIAAALGALVASRFAIKRLSPLALKRVVAVILWLIAVKMIWDLAF